jgi:hypothetical protein
VLHVDGIRIYLNTSKVTVIKVTGETKDKVGPSEG